MVVERFSTNLVDSGIFRIYTASGFFATLIFFVINIDLFSIEEVVLGVFIVTIAFKGLGNLMLALLIYFFSLKNKKEELDFKYNEENIDTLLSQLAVKDIVDVNKTENNE